MVDAGPRRPDHGSGRVSAGRQRLLRLRRRPLGAPKPASPDGGTAGLSLPDGRLIEAVVPARGGGAWVVGSRATSIDAGRSRTRGTTTQRPSSSAPTASVRDWALPPMHGSPSSAVGIGATVLGSDGALWVNYLNGPAGSLLYRVTPPDLPRRGRAVGGRLRHGRAQRTGGLAAVGLRGRPGTLLSRHRHARRCRRAGPLHRRRPATRRRAADARRRRRRGRCGGEGAADERDRRQRGRGGTGARAALTLR